MQKTSSEYCNIPSLIWNEHYSILGRADSIFGLPGHDYIKAFLDTHTYLGQVEVKIDKPESHYNAVKKYYP